MFLTLNHICPNKYNLSKNKLIIKGSDEEFELQSN